MCGVPNGLAAVSIEWSVLLWCLRVLAQEPKAACALAPQVMDALGKAGAADAAPAFGGFVAAVREGASLGCGFRCVECRGVACEERALLEAMALAQAGRSMEALLLLRGVLTPEAARQALDNAVEAGARMARAGWVLNAAQPDMRFYAMA